MRNKFSCCSIAQAFPSKIPLGKAVAQNASLSRQLRAKPPSKALQAAWSPREHDGRSSRRQGLARVLPLFRPASPPWTRGSARPRASSNGHLPAQGGMETPCAQHGRGCGLLRKSCGALAGFADLQRWSLARADQRSGACKHHTTQRKLPRVLGRQRAATATCAARCLRAWPAMLAMLVARCGPGVSAPHMHCDNSCDVLRCVALLDQDFNIYIFFRYLFATHIVRTFEWVISQMRDPQRVAELR